VTIEKPKAKVEKPLAEQAVTPVTKQEPQPKVQPITPEPKPVAKPPEVAKPVATPPAPAPTAPAPKDDQASADPATLYKEGLSLMSQGNTRAGLKSMEKAGNAGYGPASKRLMQMYSTGENGAPQDYGKAVKWKNKAKSQGVNIDE